MRCAIAYFTRLAIVMIVWKPDRPGLSFSAAIDMGFRPYSQHNICHSNNKETQCLLREKER
jgi:hypothetical protein